MSDSAKGPSAGYIYQFERALLLLASLDNQEDYISIELVDDIAKHEDKNVLLTIQAKHSILQNGYAFGDTSIALWRTLEIWVKKLEGGVFTENTQFICSANKPISKNSLLNQMQNQSFEKIVSLIENLLNTQKDKLSKSSKGSSIKKIIEIIEFILEKKKYLEVISRNIKIEGETVVRDSFFNITHVNSKDITELQRLNIYETLYGWLVIKCSAFWVNKQEAIFKKKDFDTKFIRTMNNPSVINAIFRKKSELLEIKDFLTDNYRKALFVKQIEDIPRRKEAKERIITEAINDFICSEIELNKIISTGDFTKKDFEKFTELCFKKWQEYVDTEIILEIDQYSEEERNSLALKIYDNIMKNIDLKFDEDHSFSDSTRYIQNGTFLSLSDVPKIGWHPDWELKYKKEL